MRSQGSDTVTFPTGRRLTRASSNSTARQACRNGYSDNNSQNKVAGGERQGWDAYRMPSSTTTLNEIP